MQRKDSKSDAPIMMLSAASGFIMQSDKYSRDNAGQSLKKYTLLKKGELAYNHGASKYKPYGCCFELTVDEARIPYVYHCFSLHNSCIPYVARLLNNQKIDQQLKKLISSSVRMDGLLNIAYEDYTGIDLFLPTLPEQEKIAAFLSLVDARIEKQRQLVEALKKYKRGVKSCIFSQHSSWNRDTADKLAHIATGSSNTQDSVADGKFPFFIRSANVARSNKYIFDGEAVLTIGDGQIGKVFHYINGKFDCHQRVYMITDFRKISGRYFYHFFSTFFYERAMKMSAKNTVDSVRMEMIAKMPIYYPSQEQQNKIVSLLDALDTKIMDEHQEQEKLELVKKGLLQQMFI